MSSPVTMMKLHTARAEQVKTLARAKGMTATEAVEMMINRMIEDGEIEDVLPGFEVAREGEHIRLHLNGQALPLIPSELALNIANDFENAGTAMKVGKGLPRWFGGGAGAAGEMSEMIIGRLGSGVVATFRKSKGGEFLPGFGAAMTRGMAVDLARQIRRAAAQ